ncbi:hypothetical protein EYC98_08900 [Halieaceae bacterium IMCC14734]|uniref:Outer membrane beta-barrel protein n=1 Tax=Candidatus Litorirhabdus singularis TaxID=2518993 RepID=A0ABT3TF84_9GAMM|nr:hypothetical protein [Candidatus Litorirhabdus singularis]MCX2980980.1 hypothetical protein [Candidatus Litorirhabdus singularis]
MNKQEKIYSPLFQLVTRCGCGLALSTVALMSTAVYAAETTVKAGAGINYKYDDNIRVTPRNAIELSGAVASGFITSEYSTERFSVVGDAKVGVERYGDIELDTDDPLLAEPKASDFDNESLDLTLDFAYEWERHTVSLEGRYWLDSALNTQFTDTGLGGLREIEGATEKETISIAPAWNWQINQLQQLYTQASWRQVEFESDRYVDYDYSNLSSNWSYFWNERLRLQLQPTFSRYENKAEFAVTSDTFGLEGGVIWSVTEKWQLNLLVGGTRVYTEYGGGGFFVVNPETGLIEFIEIEDQDATGFTGSAALAFDDEYQGFSFNISSRVTPSGDGVLRQTDEARAKYYWKPFERARLDFDARIGQSDTTEDRVENARDYSEAAVRFGYQFAEQWWLSARYRYRTQENERSGLGEGTGNLFNVGISYRLPEEVL